MSVSKEAVTESPVESGAEPRRRRGVVVAATALTAAAVVAALAGPQLLKPSVPVEEAAPIMIQPVALAASAGENTISCTGVLSVVATGMKNENTPVEIAVTSAPMTCTGEAAAKAGIIGAVFSTPGPIKTEAGNCHKFSAEKVLVDVDWITTDETEKKSTITIDSISRDDSKDLIPVIGKATVEGEFANADVAALPELESATKLKGNIEAQCKPGEERKRINAMGVFEVQFTLK